VKQVSFCRILIASKAVSDEVTDSFIFLSLSSCMLDVEGATLLPPPGRSGGEWGTTTYVGPLTWALAIASIPSIIGWMIVLLFLPLDTLDVYKADGKLFTADGKFSKSATSHNFEIIKSDHVTDGTPPGKVGGGAWGTTQYVGSLTWAMAIAAIPTIVGPFIILLFMPLDNRDIYKDGETLYKANGEWFKTASSHNFDIRRSAHTDGSPKGQSDGMWGTTTYVGPMTWAATIAAIPTVLGAIIILLFCPLDQEEVYKIDGKLYLPSGKLYKASTSHNFAIRKSEHTDGAPEGKTGGEWGTTTSVGPITWSLAIVSIISGIGWILILLFCPLDAEEVYKVDGKLYLPSGELYKAASDYNFHKKNSEHVKVSEQEKADGIYC
jgi:hypothetical protein